MLVSSRYRAAHDSGPRKARDIEYVVVHCTEGATAEGAARWFENPSSGGSAHIVVDDNNAFRTLPDLRIPWAAPPLNTNGWHIEIAGFADWPRDKWPGKRVKNAAVFAAQAARKYQVPAVWLSAAELKKGRRGFTSHANVSAAFHLSDHTDPGAGFPADVFMAEVHRLLGTSSKAQLRSWIRGRRKAGWSWQRIKKTARFKAFKRLGGR